jgi:iron complex transport system substrate-binding protein
VTNDDTDATETPTRRDLIKCGAAAVGSGLLAGCSGDGGGDTPERTETAEATPTATHTPDGQSYSVTMEPVGTVEFESVPETVAPFTADYIDMLVALGRADAVQSIWYRGRYKTTHYEQLDGVSVDLDGLTQLWNDGVSKELFYEMDADLHLIDPHSLTDWLGAWDQSDLEEVRERVAPFLGNLVFRRTDDWHDYRYYSLYEAFEKVAAAVRERGRFEAIRSMHDDLIETVQARLPAPAERPDAALMFAGERPEEFTPYRISGGGANKEHFRAVGVEDAFEGTGVEGYTGSESVDYETLLEIDPDSLLLRYHGRGMTRAEFEETVVAYLEDHDLGSELTAVQDGRVFRGGPIYAGPLHNLFMIERYATGLYPDRFEGEQLIDRDRLARVVTEGVEG